MGLAGVEGGESLLWDWGKEKGYISEAQRQR